MIHPLVDEIAASLAPDDWQCLSAGAGSKEPRLYNWAAIKLKDAGIVGWSHFLVIRQNMETGTKGPENTYVLVFAPVGTTLQQMVEVIGDRWTVPCYITSLRISWDLLPQVVSKFHVA